MLNIANRTIKVDGYLLCAIVLVTLGVFSPVLWYDFVNLDDPVIVYSNHYIQSGLTADSIRWAFTSQYVSNWVPLTMISHMLDVQLFGMNPAGHHAVNLLLHAASSAVLFLFLNKATKAPLRSAAAAFLFALHPMQVESVAWVAERKDVLSAFFWMLTLYAYTHYAESRGTARYLTVLILFMLGLLSKPMVVTLPVVLLLLDWWPLGRFTSRRCGIFSAPQNTLMLFIEKIPFFFLSACLSVITYLVKQGAGEIVTDFTLPERVARASVLYFKYIYKTVLPSRLAVFYPSSELPPSLAMAMAAIFALLLITGWLLLVRQRYPFLITGWLWYVLTLLPVIGLIQSGACTFADRYAYLPLVGLSILVVWGGGAFAETWGGRQKIGGAVIAGTFVTMITITSIQLTHWKNSYTLLTHAVEVTENNWLALNNLGLLHLENGKIDEAIWYFNESVNANPSYVLALVNLGALYAQKNQLEQAVNVLNRAVHLDPGNQKAHMILRVLLNSRP